MPKDYHVSTDFDCVGTDKVEKNLDEIFESLDAKVEARERKIELLEEQLLILKRSYELCLAQCETYREVIEALGEKK